jgi:hypothetical protein
MAGKSCHRAAHLGLWLLAAGCLISTAAQTEQRPLPPILFQRWVHSYEDDTAELRVYRPAGYDFPPARGRDGFEITPEGVFTLLGPGRSDRSTVDSSTRKRPTAESGMGRKLFGVSKPIIATAGRW